MKILQKLAIGGLIAGYTLLPSCIEEDYSDLSTSLDGTNAYYPTLGTVENTDPITIASDAYGTLMPNNPEIFERNGSDSIGQRVFLNVIFPSSANGSSFSVREVMVLDLYNVPTRSATDLRKAEEINLDVFGNDPVQITGSSISKEHLNIEFNFKGSGNTQTHDFTLLLTEETQLNADGMLPVELRHNAQSDTPVGWYWGVTSFTLKSIPEYQQEKFKGFLIKYNSGADTQAIWEVKKGN